MEGHHPSTCRDMLLEENCARLQVFFDKTIKAGNLGRFIRSLTARPDKTYARAVLQKLKQNSKVEVEDLF